MHVLKTKLVGYSEVVPTTSKRYNHFQDKRKQNLAQRSSLVKLKRFTRLVPSSSPCWHGAPWHGAS
jgi:hypothetical protein